MKWWSCAALIVLAACGGSETSSPEPTPAPAPEPSSSSTTTQPDASPPPADASVPDAEVDAGPPLDVPASLVAALGTKTYVEESCEPTTYAGWPFPAQRCTYHSGLVVTIANPEPERVARWIVEASSLIPALDGLHERDRTNWEAGLVVIAKHTINQSSRIFPLQGQIWENGKTYDFERGVTKSCTTGCYCRVNSTSRQQWCAYAANVLKSEDETTCLAKYGQPTKTLPEDWLAHCVANHEASWNSDSNEHYRAQAWNANNAIASKFPDPMVADGATVVTALKTQYP